ncbi:MAG: T9SS type A sorting domain-containing protein [Balneolaceae bacterium]
MMYKHISIVFLFWAVAGWSTLSAQSVNPADIITREAPEAKHVCTLDPTDFNAKHFIEHHDIVGKSASKAKTSDVNVTYRSACGGDTWPSEALNAFEYAMGIWETHIESEVPIRIEATWTSLDENVLGSAGPTRIAQIPPVGEPDTWYTIAQASAMTGEDIVNDIEDEEFDVIMNINCDFEDWYFAQDANPPANMIDFVTVVLHEIGHGIGFIGSMQGDEDLRIAEWGFGSTAGETFPIAYDLFAEDGEQISLINESVYPQQSEELYDALTGEFDGIFFNGGDANIINAGLPVKLYSPFPWQSGSSYSHLDQETFGQTENSLMRPRLDRQFAIHSPGPVMCGMLGDMGWPLGQNCFDLLGVESVIAIDQSILTSGLDYGVSNLGETVNRNLTITNEASAEDPLSGRVVIDNDNYIVSQSDQSFSILPGESVDIPIRYSPGNVNIHNTELSLFHNSSTLPNPVRVELNGEALDRNETFVVDQNYPNPFNAQTTIEYAITGTSDVRLDVYNVSGQLISTLVNSEQGEGRYVETFDASQLASGVYLYRLIVDDEANTRKLLLVK